jgi:hypothetical protein
VWSNFDTMMTMRFLRPLVDQRGAHAEALEGRLQRALQRLAVDAFGGGEGEAHEELAGLAVPELVGLGDIGVERRQLGRDRRNNPRPVGAAQRQDEVGVRHETPRNENRCVFAGIAAGVKRDGGRGLTSCRHLVPQQAVGNAINESWQSAPSPLAGADEGGPTYTPPNSHSCSGALWNFHVRFGPAITLR